MQNMACTLSICDCHQCAKVQGGQKHGTHGDGLTLSTSDGHPKDQF